MKVAKVFFLRLIIKQKKQGNNTKRKLFECGIILKPKATSQDIRHFKTALYLLNLGFTPQRFIAKQQLKGCGNRSANIMLSFAFHNEY